MGMLGALAGFGQGLQDYSKVLQKKQEQDWQDQQARVKYERELNLENLRNKNQQLLQEQRIGAEYQLAREKMGAESMSQMQRMMLEKKKMESEADYRSQVLANQAEENKANAAYRQGMLGYQAKDLELKESTSAAAIEASKASTEKTKEETRQAKEGYDKKMSLFDQLAPEQQAAIVLGTKAKQLSGEEIKAVSDMTAEKLAYLDDEDNKEEKNILVNEVATQFKVSKSKARLMLPEIIWNQTASSIFATTGGQRESNKLKPTSAAAPAADLSTDITESDIKTIKDWPMSKRSKFLQDLQAKDPEKARELNRRLYQ